LTDSVKYPILKELMTMAKSYPDVPHPWSGDDLLTDAYTRGYRHGLGFAPNNVPTLGETCWCGLGLTRVDAENIREVHEARCFEAEENSRSYSPFEFTAKEFNDSEFSEDLWEAFEAGTTEAIRAELAEFDDELYGIEDEEYEDD
jgi:hypothetical protein